MNKEEKQAYNYLEKYIEWETFGERNLEGDIKTILILVKKQQLDIEGAKTYIDTLKREIKTIQEEYQILCDDIDGHRIVYVDTPEFEENYISKDKIKELIQNHKKFLSNESSKYDEDDIENRKAIQYASARLSFLLTDIYKLGE